MATTAIRTDRGRFTGSVDYRNEQESFSKPYFGSREQIRQWERRWRGAETTRPTHRGVRR